jgi:RNase H-like domain found in reverse transcriptase/Reverse transcriptase (RNA-dependent DNA polymerase)/Integrase zinc binding domain
LSLDNSAASAVPCPIAAVRSRIEQIVTDDILAKKGEEFKQRYIDIFPPDIPNTAELPEDVLMKIKLCDDITPMVARAYSCPKKYRAGWKTLIEQHLAAGRICPSNSDYVSPAFIVPKADPNVLPRWVNNHRKLNLNTVADNHPLPLVEDILRDCASHAFYGKINMTNSFFQTRMDPASIKYTTVNTPFGLYEWCVMPMGLRNSPVVHQRCVTSALRSLIGRICHVYLDDIIIWSNSLEEHEHNVELVLQALRTAKLYCSVKKSCLFVREVDFLGHHISEHGIEADPRKVAQILDWPVPKSAMEVHAFLGLVRYVADFLPLLADHTAVLTPLTHKSANTNFPIWDSTHQIAFDAIKALVVGRDCLTTINHDDMGDNKIYLTCDASDHRTGAVLSYGLTWESARPVAYDSMALKSAQLNYPVHEKELLAIIRALQKWQSELLGAPVLIYTDHRTLENFDHQKDLLRRQTRWQEFLAQYNHMIVCIPGDSNTVADALSRLPDTVDDVSPLPIAATLSIQTNSALIKSIKSGYEEDPFCSKVSRTDKSIDGIEWKNGLLYIGNHLVIPRIGTLCEDLFRLAHDNLGHFGFEKSYASLHSAYYWPNMRMDLQQSYIPACVECQQSKGSTSKPTGPLHPLPIPDRQGDSIAIDFIGPCPLNEGFDSIVTITDRLGSDIQIAPTHTTITAEHFTAQFFDLWYCENGLPLDIVSDRDKIFVSKFWKALTKLTGIKLKMSSAYHPETDSSSERSNKSVIQSLCFHVERTQKGWVKALPLVHFNLMNMVNMSTGFTPFQLRMGHSPRLIPPLIPDEDTTNIETLDTAAATALVERITQDVSEAQDNLLATKISQAEFANKHRNDETIYAVGDKVMLSTLHRHREYIQKHSGHVTKFLPRFDGPFLVTKTHPEKSSYTLELPNEPDRCGTFHASLLRPHIPNDNDLYPSC